MFQLKPTNTNDINMFYNKFFQMLALEAQWLVAGKTVSSTMHDVITGQIEHIIMKVSLCVSRISRTVLLWLVACLYFLVDAWVLL